MERKQNVSIHKEKHVSKLTIVPNKNPESYRKEKETLINVS
jgi:hypothetical protein